MWGIAWIVNQCNIMVMVSKFACSNAIFPIHISKLIDIGSEWRGNISIVLWPSSKDVFALDTISRRFLITVTTWWGLWRLKSPASRLFTQPFVQAQIKEKHQTSVSLAFVRRIHRSPLNSPHRGPVTQRNSYLIEGDHSNRYGQNTNIFWHIYP